MKEIPDPKYLTWLVIEWESRKQKHLLGYHEAPGLPAGSGPLDGKYDELNAAITSAMVNVKILKYQDPDRGGIVKEAQRCL